MNLTQANRIVADYADQAGFTLTMGDRHSLAFSLLSYNVIPTGLNSHVVVNALSEPVTRPVPHTLASILDEWTTDHRKNKDSSH